MSKVITLHHFLDDRPMRVRIVHDADTHLFGERQWEDDDADGALYDECSFKESREQIEALLAESEAMS